MDFPEPKLEGPFDAVGLRGKTTGRHNEFGLYLQSGEPVAQADISGGLFTSAPVPSAQAHGDLRDVDTPVLFAGLAAKQFGHVILNSMGRLWALDHLPPETQVMFLPMRRARLSFYPALTPLLRLVGRRQKPLLHKGPTRYQNAYTATDLFGERYGGAASPAFRDWFDHKLPPRGPIEPGLKIYVTRSQLGAAVGRFCNEVHLERLLEADGYQIVAPEQHGLNNQARLFQRAETLVFEEGSALHLYALVQRAGQSVAVIQRRPELPQLLVGQLANGPTNTQVHINAITGTYFPPRRADNLGLTTLDFNDLRDQLVAGGFLSRAAPWSAPPPAEERASLRAGLAADEDLMSAEDHQKWLKDRRRKRRAPA